MRKINILILVLIITTLISSCASKISNETKQVEKPLTSTVNNEKLIPNTYEELDKLPKKYNPELARKNGDVVGVHGKGYNIEKLDNFIDISKNKKADVKDMIRITNYTTEGDAIIYDLIIDSKGMKLAFDSTRDEFSSPKDRIKKEYKVVDILKQDKNEGIYYIAKTSKNEELTLIYVNNK